MDQEMLIHLWAYGLRKPNAGVRVGTTFMEGLIAWPRQGAVSPVGGSNWDYVTNHTGAKTSASLELLKSRQGD